MLYLLECSAPGPALVGALASDLGFLLRRRLAGALAEGSTLDDSKPRSLSLAEASGLLVSTRLTTGLDLALLDCVFWC